MIQSFFKTKIKFIAVFFFILIFFLALYTIYINLNFFSIANVSNFYLEIGHKVSDNYLAYYLFFFLIYFLVAVFALPIAAILFPCVVASLVNPLGILVTSSP